ALAAATGRPSTGSSSRRRRLATTNNSTPPSAAISARISGFTPPPDPDNGPLPDPSPFDPLPLMGPAATASEEVALGDAAGLAAACDALADATAVRVG